MPVPLQLSLPWIVHEFPWSSCRSEKRAFLMISRFQEIYQMPSLWVLMFPFASPSLRCSVQLSSWGHNRTTFSRHQHTSSLSHFQIVITKIIMFVALSYFVADWVGAGGGRDGSGASLCVLRDHRGCRCLWTVLWHREAVRRQTTTKRNALHLSGATKHRAVSNAPRSFILYPLSANSLSPISFSCNIIACHSPAVLVRVLGSCSPIDLRSRGDVHVCNVAAAV